jgi:hypothetical protein
MLVTCSDDAPVFMKEPLPTEPPEYEIWMTDFPACVTEDPVPAGIETPFDAAILEGGVHTMVPPDNAGVTDVKVAQSPAVRVPTRAERCPLLNLTLPCLVLLHRFRRPVTVMVALAVPPVVRRGSNVILPWIEQVVEPVRSRALAFFPLVPLLPLP